MATQGSGYRGRFAPSPTGPLHLGSATTALASWLDARQQGGHWLVRMDDLDPPREVAGAADTILRQLDALGLYWDEPVVYQSTRQQAYQQAVDQLLGSGDAFYCRLSRRQLADYNHHHPGKSVAVPAGPDRVIRLAVPTEQLCFRDRLQGRQCASLQAEGGAFVVRRRDGLFAYQLACALDESDMEITHVVRGADLMASTLRQRLVLDKLGRTGPDYAHLPVLIDASGDKLSKSAGSAMVDSSQPGPVLIRALSLLRQDPPPELERATGPEILDWAVHHWRPEALRATLTLRA
jgi:glutamyl-Q tRNA(Asp) synthetase